MFPHFCGSPASLLSLQLTASDVPEHMFVVDRRGAGIVVCRRWPPMPIVEWWDLWYPQIPGAAQVVDRMSRGVQRGLRELSNAGQQRERQSSTPLESSPAVTTAPQPSPVAESFEEFFKSVWDRPLGAGGAPESSGKAPKPPHLPAPPPPQETSTPGSKVVPKSLFQSARKELLPPKGTSAKAEAPPTKTQVSGDKKPKKKAKTGSGASSKKRKIASDSSETDESDPLLEEHEWVPAAKHIPKKKKNKKVVLAPSSGSDSSRLPTDTVQDVKALATELAAGSKDGDEEKAIRAESAHVSALKVCTVEPLKCSSTARLNRLNRGFTIFSFLQSLDQAQQRRLAVEDTRKQLRQRFGWAANTPIRWVIVNGPDGKPRLVVGTPGKATKGTPRPKEGEELVFLPPQWEEEGNAARTTWPVIAVKDSTSFSNPHAAEEALKERRAQKQEENNEKDKKTMEDSPSFSPLEEKEVSPAPEAEAEKDSDNGAPVLTPPVIPEPKDTEKHIPVPSPPEVPEPRESEEQVVREEKVESAGPGVQEHQENGEDSPAALIGQEEIEEVGGAPNDEEMPACKQEDNEEAAPEAGAPVPHAKEEPLPND